jgi:hypothetical protein
MAGITTNANRRKMYGPQGITPEEFIVKVSRTATTLADINPKAVGAACLVYKNTIHREVAKELGPERRMRNWGGERLRTAGGLKVGARYDVKGRANAVGLVKGTPPGAWKAIEYGTQPHIIGLGKGATARLIGYTFTGGPNKRARGQLRRQQRNQRPLFANAGRGSRSPRSGAYSHPVSKPIAHPGTKGSRTFTRATRVAEPNAMFAYRNTMWRQGVVAVWQ